MTGRLEGKVAVVTGAGSGIGAAMVRLFCAEGARVVASDVTGAEADAARSAGEQCVAVHADVSVSADIQAMIATTIERFGRVDVLCNNAGIQGPIADTGDYDEDEWDRVVAINLKGVFLGTRYALPHMLRQGCGSIVNTSSMAALVAFPGLSAYAASKGGVSMLTKLTAAEYAARGIRVNAILPGAIDTGMTRAMRADYIKGAVKATLIGRIGTPDEIANTALFLASDESSFITGQLIAVDGGYTLV